MILCRECRTESDEWKGMNEMRVCGVCWKLRVRMEIINVRTEWRVLRHDRHWQ